MHQPSPSPYGVQRSPLRAPSPMETSPFAEQERKLKWLGIALLASLPLLWWQCFYEAPLPGVRGLPEPIQKPLEKPLYLPGPKGYKIKALYSYEIKALILSRKTYNNGIEGMFSPVDFALGWGAITHKAYVNKVKWSQRGRWYNFYPKKDFPFPNSFIYRHSANTHIVVTKEHPALRKKILSFRRGDVVSLKGYLVYIYANNHRWYWRSSTRRTDTGGHACEVMYVTEAEKIQ